MRYRQHPAEGLARSRLHGEVKAKPRNIGKITRVQSPQICISRNCHRSDGDVDFAAPGPRNSPVQTGCHDCLRDSKRRRGFCGKQRFLRLEFRCQARPSKPFIQNQRREQQTFPFFDRHPQHGCRPFRPGESVYQNRGIHDDQRGCLSVHLRPPHRRAFVIPASSLFTCSRGRRGIFGTSRSKSASMRRRSTSLIFPMRAW
ncbi:MAG: hypothetical protein H6Q05_316 [Acidobacteria bacterium]|nr:hypothetical protein [Acidobacteriota bacterium]